MSGYHDHKPDELLERYLDGLLTEDELRDFEERLQSDEPLRRSIELHLNFEELLKSKIVPPVQSVEAIESLLQPIETDLSASRSAVLPTKQQPAAVPQRLKTRRKALFSIACVLAAVLAWVFVFLRPGSGPKQVTAFFEQRPLTELYEEVVEQGFRPYYFCEDQERFARTFRKRQQVPLVLKDTPEDRRMVGLSYIGGLSRDTTAMLAYVEDQPVVVFIDREKFDNEPLFSQPGEQKMHVHRSKIGELVLYEVSPFEIVKMTPYLSVGDR